MNLPFLMFAITEDGKRDLIDAYYREDNPDIDLQYLADINGIDTSLWTTWDWDYVYQEVGR